MSKLSSWSYSRLSDFERCPKYAELKYVKRIPEPERPLPPGKTEHANDRGTRIHENCELYINGSSDDLCPEAMRHFGPQIDLLRVMHKDKLVHLEGEWGMTDEWEIAEWTQAWLRLKLDALVLHDPTTATVIDFKTGKKFGNEVKHDEQLRLYTLTSFLRHPKLEVVFAELWYLDIGEVTSRRFTRAQGLAFRNNFHNRGAKLTSSTVWPAKPSRHTCRWCQYGPWGSNDCTVGVR